MDHRSAMEAPHAERLLASVLQTRDADQPSTSRPNSDTHAHFVERLKDRRVQLSNPDRRRPEAGGGDVKAAIRAESKLAKRKRRVKIELAEMKRLRIQQTKAVRREERSFAEIEREREAVKGKQRELAGIKKEAVAAKRIREAGRPPSSKGKRIDKGADTPLSRTQRKRMGLEDVDANVSYALMLPLHHMWCSYIQQLLGMTSVDPSGNVIPNPHFSASSLNNITSGAVSGLQGSLIKADLCGAHVDVVRSSNPSLVNLSGLVVKETERTIILTPKPIEGQRERGKKTRVVPKHNTVFSLHIPLPPSSSPPSPPAAEAAAEGTGTERDGHQTEAAQRQSVRFELHGNHMMHSLPSRATRKFKARATIDF